jgi:hypothetical protein
VASGNNDEYVAGLIGYEDAAISNSYSTSPVTANGSGTYYVAGLVGENEAGILASTSASGLVTATGRANEYIAGLVGLSYGAISNSSSIGNVVATSTSEYVGGFDAYMDGGSITQSYETGNVTGAYYSMGGFVSESYGPITESFETGNVYLYGYAGYYDYYIGGFAGYSYAPLTNDYATGSIVIDPSVIAANLYYTGGFDGYSDSTITNSYSSSSITGNGAYQYLGGFIGENNAPILNSYFAGGGSAFLLGTTTGSTGYFIGYSDMHTMTNDAQYYQGTPAIGDDTTTSGSDALLATHGYGTDEHTLANFYSTTEPAYAQATTTAWDFTSIWVTHANTFPTFLWYSGATPTYSITATAGTGGTISNAGATSVQSGANQTYTITPASGYAINSVLVDGVSVGAVSTYTFSNVSAAHTISVSFTSPTVSTGGSSSGGGTVQNRVTNLITGGNTPAADALMQQYPNLFTTSSTNSQPTIPAQSIPAASLHTYTFTHALTLGSTGAEVKALQQYLNQHGFIIAATGAGSLGDETTYFGKATRSALEKFQKAKGISPAAGYFGQLTRTYINA